LHVAERKLVKASSGYVIRAAFIIWVDGNRFVFTMVRWILSVVATRQLTFDFEDDTPLVSTKTIIVDVLEIAQFRFNLRATRMRAVGRAIDCAVGCAVRSVGAIRPRHDYLTGEDV